MHKRESIKKKKEIENFLELLNGEYATDVNKTVAESQIRQKLEIPEATIPDISEIRKFSTYIRQEAQQAFEKLSKNFSEENYTRLSETTLLIMQIFNRKRAGDIQRIEIAHLGTSSTFSASSDPELYKNITAESAKLANNYVRYTSRGKKGTIVPILVDKVTQKYIECLRENRENMHIPAYNPYLFGLPGCNENRPRYVKACDIMRAYSMNCGAKEPSKLRRTFFRKHLATFSSQYLNEKEVSDLAKFMGHKDATHKQFYQLPVKTKDLVYIFQYLEKAQGSSSDRLSCSVANIEDETQNDDEQIDDPESESNQEEPITKERKSNHPKKRE